MLRSTENSSHNVVGTTFKMPVYFLLNIPQPQIQ